MSDLDNMSDEEYREWLKAKAEELREHVVPEYAQEFQDPGTLAISNLFEFFAEVLENPDLIDDDELEDDEEEEDP